MYLGFGVVVGGVWVVGRVQRAALVSRGCERFLGGGGLTECL